MALKPTTEITFVNFRDLGGLPCPDGKKIKKGKIFRSQALANLSEADKKLLSSLQLEAILDLRTEGEIAERKDWIPAGCDYFPVPVFSDQDYPLLLVSKKARMKVIWLRGNAVNGPANEKKRSYQKMPFAKQSFAKLFSLMDEGKTFVFHCAAGKDRTGISAMLIEFAFGRSYEEIRKEYLLSDILKPPHRRDRLKYFGCSQALIDVINYTEGVHGELLDLALEAMLKDYATPADFLLNEYQVTPERIARWKEFYLEA